MKQIKAILDMPPRYPSDEQYLNQLFYGKDGNRDRLCDKCKTVQVFYPVKGRKCFECAKCGYQMYPLKGTIMQGTKLPLWKWFKAIDKFSVAKNGISAIEIQNEIDVTYKIAWRMCNLIRGAMKSKDLLPLTGVIEVDETYIGGKKPRKIKDNTKAFENKTCVFGILQRNGEVRTFVVKNRNKKTLIPLIKKNVEQGSVIFSDEHGIYQLLTKEGYQHDFVKHSDYNWANGEVSTNAIEAHWSVIKRSIRGTFVHVSKKWLQSYLDEFCFRHNRRGKKGLVKQDLLEIIYNSSVARDK